jgi:protein arginine N-methyltransferase 7
MPQPTPGIHLAVSRTRLGQINDRDRRNVLITALKNMEPSATVLVLGELSLLPVLAASILPTARIMACEPNVNMREALREMAKANDLSNLELLAETPEALVDRALAEGFAADAIIAEPNFSLCLLPWHNLRFWFCLERYRKKCQILPQVIGPAMGELWAMPVHFNDLWKIRSPVGIVEGFDLKDFDDIIMVSKRKIRYFWSRTKLRTEFAGSCIFYVF